MPIYAYKCESCGHAKDVLQKISDDPLSVCPACGQASFKKQLTAAGFQLKGSGWYVTDFREGNKPPAAATATATDAKPAGDAAAAAAGAAPAPAAGPAPAPAPAAAAPAAAAPPSSAS
ncbi:FmdB family zinc ribbon protein [Hydrogenophaga sp. BPS33]|uniref:FmdB family zinc ribbon protein n=1 Tax=Hydrogenophaga sp. BPS33 TaxID=2651974 RepID=UPI001320226B|nr:FmdB family zinc ribbon protein [Hydrogenophaga sp. BPS33]QHE87925.1 zinc ribbon domain-containing protein [Hydrogenophaga sp. BPS33]